MTEQPDFMAPWDASPYFQAPLITNYSLTTTTKVVTADPMTVALIFGSSQSSGTVIAISPIADMGSGMSIKGLGVGTTVPLVLLYRDVGPLVCQDWWAAPLSGTALLMVIQIRLAKWPRPQRRKRR